MATGFTYLLNSSYLPAPPIGITGSSGYSGTNQPQAPTGGNWVVWSAYANTITPAGPVGYTGGAAGTLTINGNVTVTGTVFATSYNSASTQVLLGVGTGATGPGTGATGSSGDKIIFQLGTTGTYPVSIGNSGTTLYQSVPVGGTLKSYINGTGAMTLNTTSISMGYNAGVGPTGSIIIGPNAAVFANATGTTGVNAIAIGALAAYQQQGSNAIAIGYAAAGYTGLTGVGQTGTSSATGYIGGQGANAIAIGYQAGYENDAIFATFPTATTSSLTGTFVNAAITSATAVTAATVILPIAATNLYYYSTNGGQTFIQTTTGLVSNVFGFTVCSAAASASPIIFASQGTFSTSSAYFNGTSWSSLTTPAAGAIYSQLAASGTMNSILIIQSGILSMTYNATPTTVPTFSALVAGNVSATNTYSGVSAWNCCCVSATVTAGALGGFSLASNGSATSTFPSCMFYSSNIGTVYGSATVFYTQLTTLPILAQPTFWTACGVSATGQYMLVANSAGNVYLSSNGNNGTASNVTFTELTNISSATITAPPAGFNYITLSTTGQYMIVGNTNVSGSMYISYNYGISWVAMPLWAGSYVSFSPDNARLISAASATATTATTFYYSTLQTSPNTVAIGANAGQVNQGANAIAVGANAGQTNQGPNAVAIGISAGQTNQPAYAVAVGAYANAESDPFTYSATTVSAYNALNIYPVTFTNTFVSTYYPLCASMSSNGQIQITTSNSAFIFYSTNYGASWTVSTNTLSFMGIDSTGQYGIGLSAPGNNQYYFSTTPLGVNIYNISTQPTANSAYTFSTSSTLTTMFSATYSTSTSPCFYYFYNSSAPSVAPTAVVTLGTANNLPTGQFCVNTQLSGSGSSALVALSTTTLLTTSTTQSTSYMMYSSTTGVISSTTYANIQFTALTTANGLPASLANCFWSYSAFSSTGQYILIVSGILRSSGTGIGMGVYLSRNGANGATPTPVASLLFTRVTGLPTTYSYTVCAVSASGATMVVFGTPAPYYAASPLFGFVSYDFGYTWTGINGPASVAVSSAINSLQSTAIALSADGTRILLPTGANGAYNYATTLTQPTSVTSYYPAVSPNGQTVVLPTWNNMTYYTSTNGGSTYTLSGAIFLTTSTAVANLSIAILSGWIAQSVSSVPYYALYLPYSSGSAYYAGANGTLYAVTGLISPTSAAQQYLTAAANATFNNFLVASGGNVGSIGIVYWAYNATPASAAPVFSLLYSAYVGAIFASPANYGQLAMSSTTTPTSGFALLTYNNGTNLSQLWYSVNAHTTTLVGPTAGISFAACTSSTLPSLTNPNVATYGNVASYWSAAAMSSNGQYILAAAYNGGVYVSSNGGVGSSAATLAFTPIVALGTSTWLWANVSANGQYMVISNTTPITANNTTSSLFVSYNFGTTWAPLIIPSTHSLNPVGNYPVMSADASRIYMTVIKASNVAAGVANVGQANTVVLAYSLVQTNYQNNVAIGAYAAAFNEGSGSVAIGYAAGVTLQGANAVAVGSMSGSLYQGSGAVALGANAGMSLQGANAVAIGANAGASNQGANAVAAGYAAGAYNQGPSAVAMGYNAGASNQGANAVAIGQFAAGAYLGATGLAGFTGAINPGWTGYNYTGYTGGQGANSIAIGPYAGYETDYNLVYGPPLVQTLYATFQAGVSTDGQIIILPTLGANTYYFSINGGATFSNAIGTGGNQNCVMILSGNGLYGIFLTNNGGNPSYVTNLTISPVYTLITTINAPSSNMFNYAATSSLNYVVIPGFFAAIGPVYWTYNASPSTTVPSFITLTAVANGLPATTGYWQQPAMSANTGQYVLLNYTNQSTISSLLYSINNTSIVPSLTFTTLTQANLQIAYPIIWMGSAMSGTGQYILICNNGGGVFLSTNGGPGSTASSLVFTQLLSLPSLIMWQGATMSLSGQYMSLSTYYSASTSNYTNNVVYVSYNYGVTWFVLPLTGVNPTTFYETRSSMSGNGNVLVVVSFNVSSSIGGTTAIYTLTQNVNNVAIGSAAGYLNQLGNAVAIGTNAGQVNEGGYAVALGAGAGQTNIGANAVAIGAGAGALTDPNVVSVYNGAFQVPPGSSAVNGWNWISVLQYQTNNYNICFGVGNITPFYYFLMNTSSPIQAWSLFYTNILGISTKFLLVNVATSVFVYPQTGSATLYMYSSSTLAQVAGTTPTAAGACGSLNLNTILIMGTTGTPYWYYSTSPPAPASITFTALTSISNAITSSYALPSMNTLGTYCVIPSNTTANALYVSTNIGTATTPTFSLAASTGLPSTGSGQIAWTAMSGTGQYILVGGLNAATVNTLWLSSNGGGLAPTFRQLTGFVTPFTQVTNVGISSTGQIMTTSMNNAFGFYVSYNYGVTWALIANPLQSGVIYMSTTGSNVVYASPTSTETYIYQLMSSSSNVNTIAIGAQAGAYNQAPNAIAMGYQAGQIGQGMGSTVGSIAIGYQAGQYNQGPNAIALGFQAGQTGQPAGSFYVSPSSIRNQSVVSALAGTQVAYSNLGQLYTIAAKTFVIDHPLDPERYLVHACLEGPEAGVYYRGWGSRPPTTADDGCEYTVVDLPDYVCKIATNFTIELTSIASDDYPHNRVYNATDVVDNQFRVYGPPGEFFWHVYGTRLTIEVEPLKADVNVRGDGPYTWLGP